MQLLRIVGAALAHTRRHGVRSLVDRAVGEFRGGATPDSFDAEHGTETARIAPLFRLRIASENAKFGVRYQPLDPAVVRNAIDLVPVDRAATHFIDLGCGKGRNLIIAAGAGFRQISGVEFAEELVSVARRNMAVTGTTATLVHGDAADYRPPSGDALVFMFNPFGEPVMRQVVDGLAGRSGSLHIIYVQPVLAPLLEAAPHLERWRPAGVEVPGDVALFRGV